MWPACPPVLAPTSKADIFFGVLTAQKLLGSRARVASRVFALQGARHGLFGEVALNNASGVVTLLPESAQLELGHGRLPGSTSAGRTPYIAQKVLEMLVAMHSHPSARRARWFVVCDDDSFVFVDRLSRLFSSLNETEPLLVGGGKGQAHLCGAELCNYTLFKEQHGHAPIVAHHAGGPSYALNAAAMRRVVYGLRHGLCLDAPYTDTAVGACAKATGVRLALLPGGHVVNNKNFATLDSERFDGQLVTYHRLSARRRLCWARYGECDPRCDCPCECGKQTCSTPVSAAEEKRIKTTMAALNLTWSRKEREAALKVRWNCSAMFDCTDADLAWVPGDEGPAGGLGDSSEGHVMVAEAAAAHTFMCGPTGKDSKQRARLSSLSPATIGRVREVQAEMAHHQATQVAANIHG